MTAGASGRAPFQRRPKRVGVVDPERRRPERLRQRHEVGRPEVGPHLPPVIPQRQQPDEVVTAVAPDQVDRRAASAARRSPAPCTSSGTSRRPRSTRPTHPAAQRRADRPGETDAHRLVPHAEEQPPGRKAEEVPRRPDLVRTHVARDRHIVADHLPQVVQHAERVDRCAPHACPPRCSTRWPAPRGSCLAPRSRHSTS